MNNHERICDALGIDTDTDPDVAVARLLQQFSYAEGRASAVKADTFLDFKMPPTPKGSEHGYVLAVVPKGHEECRDHGCEVPRSIQRLIRGELYLCEAQRPTLTGAMVRDAVMAEFDLYAVSVKGIGEYGASDEDYKRHDGLAWDRVAARLAQP